MQTNAHESLEFYSFSDGRPQIADKEETRLISEGQVRKWYKRNKQRVAMAKFKKEGCQYAQPCWQKQAADERYNSGELARFGTRKPEPWVKANAREISKVFNESGNLAKKGKPSTSLSAGSVAMRNPRPAGGAPQHYVPPNRRNAAPGRGRGWNNAPGRGRGFNNAPGRGRGMNNAPGRGR